MIELTEREYALLRGFAAGQTRSQIARQLGRAPSTVDASVRRLFVKLGAVTEAQAVDRAHRLGLLGERAVLGDDIAEPEALPRVTYAPAVIRERRRVLDEALRDYKRPDRTAA